MVQIIDLLLKVPMKLSSTKFHGRGDQTLLYGKGPWVKMNEAHVLKALEVPLATHDHELIQEELLDPFILAQILKLYVTFLTLLGPLEGKGEEGKVEGSERLDVVITEISLRSRVLCQENSRLPEAEREHRGRRWPPFDPIRDQHKQRFGEHRGIGHTRPLRVRGPRENPERV